MNRISLRGRKDVRHFLHLSRQRKRLLNEPEDHNEDKEYGGWIIAPFNRDVYTAREYL